ncbi:uncharacterized protein LOC142803179 isoform X2 [Rhipicephalus microplus]|uniref:uncharacterized protein LOC142803179 isoform X2 n=1 Tax=Rhipicephalus microplus TaxID=6941 RepID=UPI003F6CECA8
MPNTCCVPGCRFSYRGTTEKVSLFSFPHDKDQREKWKRAIPRQESGDFNFESKYTRVCAKHFDASDIVTTYDFNINGDAVSLEREKPTLKSDAVPSIFGGLPSYLTKRKPRPRSSTYRSPRKRARESSCETEEQRASPTTCSDRTDAASVNEDVALTSETVETYHTDTACQTDRLVDCASCAAVQKLRCQLRATKQQLRQCQTKLAEFRKKTAKYERQQQSLQRLSDREKLIIDQCVMKANAKSGLILVKSKGFLLVPSSQLVTLLQIVEDHMEAHTVEKTACSGVYMNIVEDVLMDPRTASAAVGCKSHFVSTTAEVVQFFLKVRLHFFTRERNKQMQAKGCASCPAGGGKKPNTQR